MHRASKLQIAEVNPYLICKLCNGYFVDPCTAQECLHSFCKSCIVKHLNNYCTCPICNVVIHKTRPLEMIRHDQTLQDLVYKLIPGVFKHEMERRRHFYEDHPGEEEGVNGEGRGEVSNDREILAEDDIISMVLVHSPQGDAKAQSKENQTLPDIYLRCPASFPIVLLKKFIRVKYELDANFLIDVFHSDESLSDNYTLMDVAYIYTWRRRGPLRLFYTIYEFDPNAKVQSQSDDTTSDKEKTQTEDVKKQASTQPVTVSIKEGFAITDVTIENKTPSD